MGTLLCAKLRNSHKKKTKTSGMKLQNFLLISVIFCAACGNATPLSESNEEVSQVIKSQFDSCPVAATAEDCRAICQAQRTTKPPGSSNCTWWTWYNNYSEEAYRCVLYRYVGWCMNDDKKVVTGYFADS